MLGPPTVEFAPYGRIPSDNPRQDARQGTIDQDQEFIDFLEGLTNPLPKKTLADQEEETVTKSKEKVTTTPLIQFLRDKKANKGKEPSTGTKVGKHTRQDSKDSKMSPGSEKKTPPKPVTVPSPEKRSTQAIKVENAARDAVKVLSKQASANNKKAESSEAVASLVTIAPNAAPPSAPLAGKKRERGNASAAARILQRDLGLGGGPDGRGGRGGRRGGSVASVKADPTPTAPKISILASESSTTAASTLQEKPPVAPPKVTPADPIAPAVTGKEDAAKAQSTKAANSVTPPTGPAASRVGAKPNQQPRDNSTPTKPSGSPKGPTISPTATQAFLKHANPSQGITEPLLEEAFAGFGTVKKVEIDKKKGFGYVDFAEPDGLQKAIQASPVKIAQGQVVVLERKTSPTSQSRNVRGGPAMAANRGGGVPLGPRGGRGGSMRRGGGSPRPPYNANAPKPSQPSTATAVQPTTVLKNPASAAAPSETKVDSHSEPSVVSTATPET